MPTRYITHLAGVGILLAAYLLGASALGFIAAAVLGLALTVYALTGEKKARIDVALASLWSLGAWMAEPLLADVYPNSLGLFRGLMGIGFLGLAVSIVARQIIRRRKNGAACPDSSLDA
jgi:hypothetical protein